MGRLIVFRFLNLSAQNCFEFGNGKEDILIWPIASNTK